VTDSDKHSSLIKIKLNTTPISFNNTNSGEFYESFFFKTDEDKK